MRMLMLTRYGPLGASSRLRAYQYVPALKAAGIDLEVSPLLDDNYVRALYARRRRLGTVVAGFLRRLARMLTAGSYDLVWVEYELLPWMPASMERLLGSRAALIVDYDDAVFHRYDMHRSRFVRRMLGRKIDDVMRGADLVITGNNYLADRATGAGCPRVEQVPTVVDLKRYTPRVVAADNAEPVVIGWIGSPATAHYLQMISPALEVLGASNTIQCVAVGARPDQLAGTRFTSVPWTEASEAEQVARFDIGVMPLQDGPWERGKCGYKLIQYMACGLPVVASPVGVNTKIVAPGVSGILASNTEGWMAGLSRLVENSRLRERMGMAGRQRVEEWYSLQVQAPRLVDILHDTVRRGIT